MAINNVQLDDKYVQESGRVFLTGSQALARLPMLQESRDRAAGLNTAGFISGYRGSPLGGFDKTLWQARQFLAEHKIHFQPGVNEELAATAVWGSQQVNIFDGARHDGVFGMWYGKGPGVDRSGDVLRHANHAGTSRFGGVLAIAGDDHGCKSSTLPHQSEYAFVDAMIPILNPAGVQEIIDLGLFGWALSRYSGCWVALKTIAETVDASYSTAIDPDRVKIVRPEESPDVHLRWPDKPLEQELRLHNLKLPAVLAFARANRLNHITIDSPEPRLGIISTGKAYLDVLQALDDLGIDDGLATKIGLRLYKVGMPWPLEPEGLHEFAAGLSEVIVVEEKRGLIEEQLTSELYNWHSTVRPVVVGKRDEVGQWLLPSTGELTPAVVARVIAARIQRFFTSETMERRLRFLKEKEAYLNFPKDIAERTPHFCSGCPHNTSTRVPEGSRAMGGIGCHYMATWMERETETFTQMGGEGATWIGQAPFTETAHVFQNLGDGTYFHSGLLAIRAAVAAGVNITYKILYNDAVAMTGGQPLDGELSVAQLCEQLKGEGISRIAVVSDDIDKYQRGEFPDLVTFDHRDNLDSLQQKLRLVKGTSVLVYDQTCAAEKRRRRKRGQMIDPPVRAFINSSVCEGCGDCGVASNCLSVVPRETEYGRKRAIEQSSCNKDMSCVKGFCPSFVTVTGGRPRSPKKTASGHDFSKLPEPDLPVIDSPYGIVLAGVGGTGVTTLGAILGMAAHLEGRGSSVLDMTGLAQKFGAVLTHLQIARQPEDIHAARIAAGGARLVIGCDLVVAASNDAMAKVDQAYAHAVVNSHEAMTAEFTRNPDARFPARSMKNTIVECVGADKTHFVNASDASDQLLGETMATNIFLAGYAFQQGLIPISSAAIMRAIELNGAAVAENTLAFQLGRLLAHEPAALAFRDSETFTRLETLDEILADRRQYLVDYQGEALAGRYLALVHRVSAAAQGIDGGDELAKVVARSYFKLLAYKDEYEVARLFSSPGFRQQLDAEFEGDYTLKYHLAPPLIAPRDGNGQPTKIAFGSWMGLAFRILARLRFLRGTAFDPFAYTRDRKLERQLIADYEADVAALLPRLDASNIKVIRQLLTLPDRIRGFGHIKEKNVQLVAVERENLMRILDQDPEPVRLVDPRAA
ncbi:MAG: indolepyruvate ferredoxin oxidoreductase family protein [Pseudomonadota bacterium]